MLAWMQPMHRPNSQRSYSCSAITNSSNRRYAASLRRNKDPCFSTIFVMWFLLCHCQAESSFELGLLRVWISLRWIRITRASLMILAKALIESLTEHPTLRAKDGKSSPSFLLTSPSSPSFAAGVATAASCAPRRERWSLIVVGPAVILLVAVVAATLASR